MISTRTLLLAATLCAAPGLSAPLSGAGVAKRAEAPYGADYSIAEKDKRASDVAYGVDYTIIEKEKAKLGEDLQYGYGYSISEKTKRAEAPYGADYSIAEKDKRESDVAYGVDYTIIEKEKNKKRAPAPETEPDTGYGIVKDAIVDKPKRSYSEDYTIDEKRSYSEDYIIDQKRDPAPAPESEVAYGVDYTIIEKE